MHNKVLLTTLNSKYVHSNLALRYLYTVAAMDFENVALREFTINNELDFVYQELATSDYDVIAFSCYIWNIEQIKRICQDLKIARPDIKIMLGGPEVSFNAPEFMRENPWADYILQGEGELSFYKFVEVLNAGNGALNEVPSLVYRQDGKLFVNAKTEPLDMMVIPFPYSILPPEKDRVVYYESMRGCPYRCSYCLSSIDKGVRALTLERVKREIDYFLKENVMQVKFIDRTFNYDKKRAYAIFRHIITRDNGHTSFHFEICADLLDDQTLVLLKTARKGLIELEIGVQSTNPETLNAINRSSNVYPSLQNIAKLVSLKTVHTHVDLIAGLPFEDYESFGRSFNKVYSLGCDAFQLGFLKVLKGTAMMLDAPRHNIKYRAYAPYEVLSTDCMSPEELVRLKLIEDMVDIFYNRGGFSSSVPYLIEKYSNLVHPKRVNANGGNAFMFYEALAEFYKKNGFRERDRRKDDQYRILMKFAKSIGLREIDQEEAATLIELDAKEYMDELNFKRFLNKGWEIK